MAFQSVRVRGSNPTGQDIFIMRPIVRLHGLVIIINAVNARLLRNRNFMALWLGQLISFIGDYFNYLAIPITINQLTGSAGMVGLSYIANALPALLFGPIAGVFVDRLDRRRVMIASDLLRGLLVLCLLTIHDKNQIWIFYLIGFLVSCTSQFFFPARGAVLPLIVTHSDDWLTANGMMQIIQTVGLLAGPAMAGFAIGLWGPHAAFIANSVGYFCSAAAVISMRVPHMNATPSQNGATVRGVLEDLKEGIQYLFSNRNMVGVMVCMAVANLGLGAINVIWVPYMQRTFGVDARGLGIVDSAQGAGMVVGALLLGLAASRFRKIVMASGGMILISVLISAWGLANTFPLVIFISVLVGLFLVPLQSALSTIQQMEVPNLKRGRVGSSMNALTTIASLASMAFASLLGEVLGLRTIFFIVGVFTGASGILGLFLLREPERPAQELPVEGEG